MDIGIRELKARLSEFLNLAENGEIIRVTDRGKPKAMLGPLPGKLQIETGIKEGWIMPGNGKPWPKAHKRFKADRTVAALILEDRGE